uniref:Uncharacterized protein n=1 Tax=Tetranychus urticae TaxID=32264 RepID=T1K5N3_TETUR
MKVAVLFVAVFLAFQCSLVLSAMLESTSSKQLPFSFEMKPLHHHRCKCEGKCKLY